MANDLFLCSEDVPIIGYSETRAAIGLFLCSSVPTISESLMCAHTREVPIINLSQSQKTIGTEEQRNK